MDANPGGPDTPGDPQPDTTPPAVVSADATSNRTVVIVFSEAVLGADDPVNYQIVPDLAVEGVSVAADGKTVTLSTAPRVENQAYGVLIQNVTDASGNAYQPGANPNDTSFVGAGQESGVLRVVVSGLPAGVDADVRVSGPGGFSRSLTATTDLSVPSGTYRFSVSSVTPDSATFAGASGNPGEIAFDASAGETVTLAYACTAVDPPDPNLHAALQDATGKSEYACADLAALTGLTATNKGVAGLEGLQYAVGLTSLLLNNNQLASLPPAAPSTPAPKAGPSPATASTSSGSLPAAARAATSRPTTAPKARSGTGRRPPSTTATPASTLARTSRSSENSPSPTAPSPPPPPT